MEMNWLLHLVPPPSRLCGFFSKNKRFSAVKNLLSPRYHIELAKGSTEQNVAYCTKDGWVTERELSHSSKKQIGQNERERWKEIIRHAKEGTLKSTTLKCIIQL